MRALYLILLCVIAFVIGVCAGEQHQIVECNLRMVQHVENLLAVKERLSLYREQIKELRKQCVHEEFVGTVQLW